MKSKIIDTPFPREDIFKLINEHVSEDELKTYIYETYVKPGEYFMFCDKCSSCSNDYDSKKLIDDVLHGDFDLKRFIKDFGETEVLKMIYE